MVKHILESYFVSVKSWLMLLHSHLCIHYVPFHVLLQRLNVGVGLCLILNFLWAQWFCDFEYKPMNWFPKLNHIITSLFCFCFSAKYLSNFYFVFLLLLQWSMCMTFEYKPGNIYSVSHHAWNKEGRKTNGISLFEESVCRTIEHKAVITMHHLSKRVCRGTFE